MKRSVLALIALCASVSVSAHDFWLWPETFRPTAGGRVALKAGVGEEFPKFTNEVPLERVEGLRLIGPRGEQPLAAWDLPVPAAGAHLVALTIKPRFIELKPDQFKRYITEEEFAHVIEARRQAGAEQQPGREIYSRYAKLLLEAAGGADGVVTKPVGHELEIVPEKNPARLRAGEELPVRVLFRGRPLANARVAAAPAGALSPGGHNFPVVARTGADGRARLRLDRAGPWYARMIHMTALQSSLEGKDADWRSFFATLTFSVGP